MTYVGYSEPYPFTRGDTFMRRGGKPGQHRGSDTAPGGLPALSMADGVIAARTKTVALGNIVVIKFADGKFQGIAHLAAPSTLPIGARVERLGNVGATIGNTGTASKGRHMHYTLGNDLFGIISGHVEDPIAYVQSHPVRLTPIVTPANSGTKTPVAPPVPEEEEENMIKIINSADKNGGILLVGPRGVVRIAGTADVKLLATYLNSKYVIGAKAEDLTSMFTSELEFIQQNYLSKVA